MKRRGMVWVTATMALLILGAVLLWQTARVPEEAVPEGSLRTTKPFGLRNDHTANFPLIDWKDMNRLTAKSTLVVFGKVSFIRGPVLVQSSDGSVSAHLDVELVPEEVFRGSAGEKLVLRLPCERYGNRYYDRPETPELFLGQSALFFLYRSAKGFGIYTAGGQYYLSSLREGVFDLASDKTTFSCLYELGQKRERTETLHEVPAREAVFSRETLCAFCEELNRTSPYDEQAFAAEWLQTSEENWKNGIFTKKSYEEDVARQDLFAVEITEEELRALEWENDPAKEFLTQHR